MNKVVWSVSALAVAAVAWAGAVYYTGNEVDIQSTMLIEDANQAMQGEASLVTSNIESSLGKRSYTIELQDIQARTVAKFKHEISVGPGIANGQLRVVNTPELSEFLEQLSLKELPATFDWNANIWAKNWNADFVVAKHDLSQMPGVQSYSAAELRLVMNGDINGEKINAQLVWPGVTIVSDEADILISDISMNSVSSLLEGVYLNDDFSLKVTKFDVAEKNAQGDVRSAVSSQNLILASRGEQENQQISGDMQLSSEYINVFDPNNAIELSNTQLMLKFKDFSWEAFKLAQQNVEDLANPELITELIVAHGFELSIDKFQSDIQADNYGRQAAGAFSANGRLDLAGGPVTVSDEELIPRIKAVIELKVDEKLVNHFAGPYAQQIPLLVSLGYIVQEGEFLKTKLEFDQGQLVANDAAPIPL